MTFDPGERPFPAWHLGARLKAYFSIRPRLRLPVRASPGQVGTGTVGCGCACPLRRNAGELLVSKATAAMETSASAWTPVGLDGEPLQAANAGLGGCTAGSSKTGAAETGRNLSQRRSSQSTQHALRKQPERGWQARKQPVDKPKNDSLLSLLLRVQMLPAFIFD